MGFCINQRLMDATPSLFLWHQRCLRLGKTGCEDCRSTGPRFVSLPLMFTRGPADKHDEEHKAFLKVVVLFVSRNCSETLGLFRAVESRMLICAR